MTDCSVYRAERRAWKRVAAFRDVVPDAQAFVSYVSERAPFTRMRLEAGVPRSMVTVSYGARQRTVISCACWREQHIEIAHGTKPTQGLLLHELAHLCSPDGAHHDARFAANNLTLVRHWLGTFAAEELLRDLRYMGVAI